MSNKVNQLMRGKTTQLKHGDIMNILESVPKSWYHLNPSHEIDYFSPSSRIRKVHYTELEYQSFTYGNGGSFNVELSSSCVRPKHLILIPVFTAEVNAGFKSC